MDKKVEFFHFQFKLETIVCVKIWFRFQNFDCLSFRKNRKNTFSKARIGDDLVSVLWDILPARFDCQFVLWLRPRCQFPLHLI